MVMLRPERVVFKKEKSFSISSSMLTSISLESVPSLYSSNWFASRLASTADVSPNWLTFKSSAEGVPNCSFSPIGYVRSHMLRGRMPALHLVVSCRTVL